VKRVIVMAAVAMVAASVGAWAPASAQTGPQAQDLPEQVEALDLYTTTATAEQASAVVDAGLDVASSRQVGGGNVELDVVLSQAEAERVEASTGVDLVLKRNAAGQTAAESAAAQAAGGFQVWRSWDEAGGIADEIDQIAADHPNLVKRVVLGHTYEGREIVALKVTHDANRSRDGSRPAAVYMAAQHAREWISVEVNRRLLHHVLDEYADGNRGMRRLLQETEMWFVLVANPDGYQFTFDSERLWRKNLRDNDGNGVVTRGDGVDPNRNYDEHFDYDAEGSSEIFADDTYRGPSAASEPETQAIVRLFDRVRPEMLSNFHSYGPLILYPQGWQTGTPDADNPIYAALAGTDANPAIEGFDPGLSSDELYVTNGETTDFAATNYGTIGYTPELDEGCPGCGFVFPDDEALVQAEFEKTLEFSLSLARSARHPDDPESSVGAETEPFYLDQDEVDAENGALSAMDFTFDVSYGNPQPVRVLAQRSLGDVTVRYRINGGRTRDGRTHEWDGGQTYGPGGSRYYAVMEGEVRSTHPGDSVEVWFEAGRGRHRERSDSFTYRVASDSDRDVLVMAAEDYTGASPAYADQTGPTYLSFYTDALEANGIAFDVYDVDANGRTAPDPLGVLSHYDAVLWYTGDDVVTREAGWAGGNMSRLAMTELFAVRDFVNEGGRVLYAGKYAGQQYTMNLGDQLYDPFDNAQCTDPAVEPRCRSASGSGNFVGDVLQYMFGAYTLNLNAGVTPEGGIFDVAGVGDPLAGQDFGFNGADSAQNHEHAGSFITTSGILPPDRYPQFESEVAARYDRAGGPFDPHSGEFYLHSQISDVTYKRVTQTIDVPAGGGNLSFWVSHDTEAAWDHFFVEAHHPGQDDWTTLPDTNGHTTQEPGDSCPAGWGDELHPQLHHYQTVVPGDPDPTCTPTGTTGEWNAASGSSGGWQQWSIDLADYAGGQVEISLTYASDWSTQGLGVFLDDIAVSTGQGSTDFEADMGGWEVAGAPEGSAPNFNDFHRITGAGFPEAAVVTTADTVFMGFGLEGVTGADTRAAVLGRVVDYLLR
jgi:zinc carboxypeptidase